MSLVPLRVVLDHAAENGYGVAAFNVNNMEQIQAIMEAAQETDSPVIIQASRVHHPTLKTLTSNTSCWLRQNCIPTSPLLCIKTTEIRLPPA